MTLEASAQPAVTAVPDGLTPFELVLRHFKFPDYIVPHPIQVGAINRSCGRPRNGLFLDMGLGKSFVETAIALYRYITEGAATVVVMPPLLIPQWASWLRTIRPALNVIEYRGAPAERSRLSFEGAHFVLVGVQIFKKDFKRFREYFTKRRYRLAIDEATIVANPQSDSHKVCYEFSVGVDCDLLTGTPANKPSDAYGILKFTAPGTYRNRRHFDNTHVEEVDFFGNPSKWMNLDVLNANLQVNAERAVFTDMYPDSADPLYWPLDYDLDDDHYKLYKRLAEEELLKLPDGGKIEATTVQKLRHALGQIILNHDHFSGNDKAKSAGIELIGQKLDELGGRKLVVFADYRMTVRGIVRRFGDLCAGQINSEVSEKQKERAKQAFINEVGKRLLVIQYISGGKGLDGLQHVCSTALCIEPCLQSRDFHQAVARLHRTGQRQRVAVYMAKARGTTQVRGFNQLIANDTIANQVVRNAYDLRKAIFGE